MIGFSTRSSFRMFIRYQRKCAVGTVYVLNIGFWRSPTSVFEVGFEKSDSKLVSWHQLALLAAVANSKIFVQKNNRPLQVELENGRSRLQNDFQIFESMLRGFIAPANLLTSVNRLNKKIRKRLLPGAVKHPATLISRQHSLSAENHRNSSSEIINRHQKMAENAEIQ